MGWPQTSRTIESRNHPLLKRVRAIIRSGELLDKESVLLETPRLVADAISSGMGISCLILRDPVGAAAKKIVAALPNGVDIIRVPDSTFHSLSTTESTPSAIALVEAPHWQTSDLFPAESRPTQLLIVAGVQDPGNLGTMLRAAEAFGFTGAILLRGTVSPWNSKAFRASAGSALRLPVLRNFSPTQAVQLLEQRRVNLYGALAHGGPAPEKIRIAGAIAIAVGAEAAGLPPEIQRASQPLSIPMAGQIDSLNVASAAAIIMYEVARLRTARNG